MDNDENAEIVPTWFDPTTKDLLAKAAEYIEDVADAMDWRWRPRRNKPPDILIVQVCMTLVTWLLLFGLVCLGFVIDGVWHHVYMLPFRAKEEAKIFSNGENY